LTVNTNAVGVWPLVGDQKVQGRDPFGLSPGKGRGVLPGEYRRMYFRQLEFRQSSLPGTFRRTAGSASQDARQGWI
jgi:hypothetical protein